MNLITKLLMLKDYNVIYTFINYFLKKRYYMLYYLNN